jgi:DNA invertase Pin-like site-specific DNA recombinase
MNLAGYIRVSTEGQVDAFGKDVQRDAIRRWALLNGHTVDVWYEEDGVSGKTDSGDRPELRQLLADSSEFDGVVFFDPTRIARRAVVQETLLGIIWGAGLKVFTTTAGEMARDEDDPTKILIRQVLAIVAEFDHRSTVKKLHAARRIKSAQGGYIGGPPPYGFRVVGTGKGSQLVPDAEEVRHIEEIRNRHGFGESMTAIAASLNRRQIPTRQGKLWSAVQVSRILARYENE